jgi:RHS repeat-associated protein
VTLRFNRYNSRGDVVGQSDAAGVTTWAATYQADGRRTGEIGTNLNPKHATGRVRELGVNRDRHRANTKEEDPTGLLNEGFRYRDMETGTFISRDPLGHVDGPNVYCYVGQNPWTAFDPEGLFVGALVKRINEHIITPAAEGLVGAMVDALPQSAVEQLSSSRGFESAVEAGRTVSGGIMHGSQEALGMLSPMDGAADKLLKGDLSGAVKEAAIEAGGGRVFKAAGKGLAAVKRHAGKLDEAVGALSHADDAATATATGVRESIEEASSVLAKEGGGAAKTTVHSTGQHVLPATTVRSIGKGETIASLETELAELTYKSGGLEHAIISLKGGGRSIVSGGRGGIEFGPDLKRVIGHTHPTPTGPSAEDFRMLRDTGQRHSYIYELFGGGRSRFNIKE